MKKKYLHSDTMKSLLSSIDNRRDRLMFTLMYAYGMRVQEVINLTLSDVDIEHSEITVRPLKRRARKEVVYQIPHKICSELEQWLLERPQSDSEALFVSSRSIVNGKYTPLPMTYYNVLKLFKRYCKAQGIPDEMSHTHVARHSFVAFNLSQGVNPFMVKEMTRHATMQGLQPYMDMYSEERNKAVANTHEMMGF
jgi:integrase